MTPQLNTFRRVVGDRAVKPLFYEKKTHLGAETVVATFLGCNFHVQSGVELTAELDGDNFTGVISNFSIARVSPMEIHTTVTMSRSDEWSKARSQSRDRSTHGSIERS